MRQPEAGTEIHPAVGCNGHSLHL